MSHWAPNLTWTAPCSPGRGKGNAKIRVRKGADPSGARASPSSNNFVEMKNLIFESRCTILKIDRQNSMTCDFNFVEPTAARTRKCQKALPSKHPWNCWHHHTELLQAWERRCEPASMACTGYRLICSGEKIDGTCQTPRALATDLAIPMAWQKAMLIRKRWELAYRHSSWRGPFRG